MSIDRYGIKYIQPDFRKDSGKTIGHGKNKDFTFTDRQ